MKPTDAAALRLQAEAAMRAVAVRGPQAGSAVSVSAESSARLLHELQVHQVELELQNEELRRAHSELEAAGARYVDLYDQAPVGYCLVDAHGLILQANLRAASLLGMARAALVHEPLNRFIVPEDQDSWYQRRRQLLRTALPQFCELRMKTDNGTPLWVQLAASVVPAAGGAATLRIVLSDITLHRVATDELDVSHQALAAVSQGVLIAGPDRTLLTVNQAFTAITGYARTEVLGRSCRFLQGPLTR